MTNRAIHGVLELYIRLIINRATGEVDYDICIGRGHQIWRGLSYSLSSQGIYSFTDRGQLSYYHGLQSHKEGNLMKISNKIIFYIIQTSYIQVIIFFLGPVITGHHQSSPWTSHHLCWTSQDQSVSSYIRSSSYHVSGTGNGGV